MTDTPSPTAPCQVCADHRQAAHVAMDEATLNRELAGRYKHQRDLGRVANARLLERHEQLQAQVAELEAACEVLTKRLEELHDERSKAA